MCTVTYIPKALDQFILTSNRDETPKRQPDGIFVDTSQALIYPKEPRNGGTWICASADGCLLCLLNGAFERHEHQPPYRRSRGLLVLDYFEYKNIKDFIASYEFSGIEPFTLVVYEAGELFELRWDEQQAHLQNKDARKAHIWSSSTLYPLAIKNKREAWFKSWLSTAPNPSAAEILAFHQNAGDGDSENDLLMSRYQGALQTVSITQFESASQQMQYMDLIQETQDQASFP